MKSDLLHDSSSGKTDQSEEEAISDRSSIVSRMSLLKFAFGTTIALISFPFAKSNLLLYSSLVDAILLSLVIYLSLKRKNLEAGILFLLSFNFSIALISLSLNDVSIMEYGFLADCVLVPYLFKSKILKIASLIFCLLLVLLQRMINKAQPAIIFSQNTKILIHWLLYTMAIFFTLAIAYLYKKNVDRAFRLRVRSELEEAAANNEKELNKIKDLQLHITHDIRGAYAGVATICSMIEERVSTNKEITIQIAQRLVAASENYKNILTDILEFSKYKTGHAEDMNYSYVNIHQEINKIIFSHSVISEERNIKTVTKIEPGFPNAILTDRIKIYRIVNNIYNNAIKFAREDSSVIMALSHSPSNWALQISDQGEGIQPSQVEKVFEPYTTDKSVHNREGNGLGLYITKLLLETLEGGITVESKLGEGTSFKLTLPIRTN